jgi:hypothetical protein
LYNQLNTFEATHHNDAYHNNMYIPNCITN